ncbi:MAG TPA: hypothetical protein VN577_18620 [Terriglobales bacterium]|nr:hypothetical protein [Terriglobales bacterium]
MRTAVLLILCSCFTLPLAAQQNPYFVTYDHHMEEPGNLEIAHQSTIGLQKQNLPTYWAPLVELEYGWTGWWTSSLYLEGASQNHDAAIFTGYRIENRWKPINRELKVNPLLYFEYERISEGSRIQKEVVGHAELSEETLRELHGEKMHEIEGKLILSSNAKGWNISENFIAEKNLTEDEGVEFGYALGVARPLSLLASGTNCSFCRENLVAGLELYGGLGSSQEFGFKETAHYLAPSLVWNTTRNSALKVSPAFGLTHNSARMLIRFGYMYEINGFGSKVKKLFGAN